MPARYRRLAIGLPVLLALALVTGGAPAPVAAASSVTYDTYFWSSYERQVNSRTCTAASTAMMMNILNGRDMNLDQRSDPALLAAARCAQRFGPARDRPARLGEGRDVLLAVHRPTDDLQVGGLHDGGGGTQTRGVPDRAIWQGGRTPRPARTPRCGDDRLHDHEASPQRFVQGDRDLLQRPARHASLVRLGGVLADEQLSRDWTRRRPTTPSGTANT